MDYTLARRILGNDFLRPTAIMRATRTASYAHRISYTPEQMSHLRGAPCSKQALEWCRDQGSILLPGPPEPLSLIEVWLLRKKDRIFGQFGLGPSPDDTVKPLWYMLRKGPVPSATGCDFPAQQEMLSIVEDVPNAAECLWALTVYHAVTKGYPLKDCQLRTSSLDSNGNRYWIGRLDMEYFFGLTADADEGVPMGLASIRRF